MFAKVKSPVFIDTVRFEVADPRPAYLKAVLKDDKGSVCSTFESSLVQEQRELHWHNLNDLPYGVYTLELSSSMGQDPFHMRLVKRV